MKTIRVALNACVLTSFCATLAFAALDRPTAWVALGTLAATLPAVLVAVVPRLVADVDWFKYSAFVCTPLVGLSCHWLSTLDVFIVAWALAPCIFLPLYLLDEAGLVNYPVSSGKFMLQRMLFYATVRAYAVAAEERLHLPALAGRTLLLLLGTTETVGMAVWGVRHREALAYEFPICSLDFATYAIVKSAWLLSLPLLEEPIRAALDERA